MSEQRRKIIAEVLGVHMRERYEKYGEAIPYDQDEMAVEVEKVLYGLGLP